MTGGRERWVEELRTLDGQPPGSVRAGVLQVARRLAGGELAWSYGVIEAQHERRYGGVAHTDGSALLEASISQLTGAPLLTTPWLEFEHPRRLELEGFVDLETHLRWHGSAAYRGSSLYRALYCPAGVTSEVSLHVYDGPRFVGWLGVVRLGGTPFGPKDRRRLASAVAPVRRAMVAAERAERALMPGGPIHLLVGANGEVRHASKDAAALLATSPLRGLLAAHVAAYDRREWTSPVFHAGMLECRIARLDATPEVAYLVTAERAAAPRLSPTSALTAAQRRIARHAMSGATVAEIARAVGSKPETVRTHLREIYRRLGVSTRVELAEALGGLAQGTSPRGALP